MKFRFEKSAAVLVALAYMLILLLISWLTGYNGLYGQDAHEYFRYANRLALYFTDGIPPGPFFWPVNYPLAGAWVRIMTCQAFGLQLVSIVSAALLLGLLIRYLLRQFPGREKEVIFYAVVFLGCSPFFFRYAISCMSDTLAMALACFACYLLYLSWKFDSARHFIAAFFVAALAIFSRLAMVPLLLPVFAWTLVTGKVTVRFKTWFYATVLASGVVAVHFYFKQQDAVAILNHANLLDWSPLNFFRRSFNMGEGHHEYLLPNLLAAFAAWVHPGIFFVGPLALYSILRNRKNIPNLAFPAMLSGMVVYLVFIAGLNYQNVRYLVPVLPFLLVIAFPHYMKAVAILRKRKGLLYLFAGFAVTIQVALACRAFLPFYRMHAIEREVIADVNKLNPSVLFTFGIDGAARNYGYPGTIINLYDSAITVVPPSAALLFNPGEMQAQWKHTMPMRNFEALLAHGGPVKIDTLQGGWCLYELRETYLDPHSGVSGE